MLSSTETDLVPSHRIHKCCTGTLCTTSVFSLSRPHIFIFVSIALSPSVAPLTPSMMTRKKNKSAHPGVPDMTPAQLASANLPRTRTARCLPKKRATKDQQKTAFLDNGLQATQVRLSNAMCIVIFRVFTLLLTSRFPPNVSPGQLADNDSPQMLMDAGEETEPATDIEDSTASTGMKRKASRSAGSTSKFVLILI